jgi:phosphoribosylaminoimidazole carboxylase
MNERELASVSDVVTIEIEHVNADMLEELEADGKPVHPSPKTIRLIQVRRMT